MNARNGVIGHTALHVTMAQAAIQGFQLSPQQHRTWRLQMGTPRPVYRAQCAVTLDGELDVERLRAALASTVARHEILRTVFRRLPGMTIPCQVILDGPVLALCTAPPVERADAAALLRASRPPFDYEHGPVVRVSLVPAGRARHLLLVDVPALCADAHTLRELVVQMAESYGGVSGTRAEPSIQYADFSQWIHDMRQSADAVEGRAYWQRAWSAGANAMRIAGSRAGAPPGGFDPRSFAVELPPHVPSAVRELAHAWRTTASVVSLAAWYVLLWRLGAGSRPVVGVVRDGRTYPELRGSLGPFATSFPVGCHLAGGASFADHVHDVIKALSELDEWQDTFDWTYLDVEPHGEPPFAAAAFEKGEPPLSMSSGGVTFATAGEYVCGDRFDLKLSTVESDAGLELALWHNADLWTEDAAARLASRLQALLADVCRDPRTPVDRLDLMAADERHRVLVSWNETEAPYPERCLHELVAAQAARTPDAVAIVCGDAQVTYRELDARSDRVARYLQARGVGPDVIVGVCLQRSADLVVALMSVLKAGGAYLPLDPAYPPKRLQFMLEDTKAPIVLTERGLVARLPRTQAAEVCLDAAWRGVQASPTPLSPRARPDNLAYVIYTSGSTGTPKGTLIPHRGLVNYLTWCVRTYPVEGGSGALVHSSISFDLTITGLFAPLVAGRPVRLVPEDVGIDRLGDALRRESDLGLVKLTPSHLRLLADQVGAASAAGRTRAFVIGGESLTAEAIAFWRDAAADTVLFNEYGPTETVVGCCVYRVREDTPRAGAVPIGRPIANTELYVLDRRMEPVPIGAAGELYIGGVGLARGYHGRPDLTAERFVPQPFGAAPGGRLYRTGDRARYEPDGTLAFLGRADDQVKVRGMRVELGEVEAALQLHPLVRAAAAALRPTPDGEPRLVGYVVPIEPRGDAEDAGWREELRAFVGELLPGHMVPSACVVVDQLPLTSNGKVDRDALPAPESPRPRRAFVAPASPLERLLADAWERTLAVSPVGVEDDFFELGGDSILCFQVIHKAHQAGVRLTLQHVFRHRTIRSLAAALAEEIPAPRKEQDAATGPVPLTPIQRWFFEQELPAPHHFNQAVLLDLHERPDAERLSEAIACVMRHHEALRLRFTRDAGVWRQQAVDSQGPPPFAVVPLGDLPPAERAAAFARAAAEAQASLHLSDGPLLRAVLFDGGPGDWRLLLVVHHLAVDAVSWRIILEDLHSAWQQLCAGTPVELPATTTPFTRWAEVLAAAARQPSRAGEPTSWLEPYPPVASFPVDSTAGPNDIASADTVSVALTAEDTQALLHALPRGSGTAMRSALLTGVAAAIGGWTGTDAVLVDVEGHGREAIVEGVDLSRTVGWFTSLYPVVLTWPAGSTPREALAAIDARLGRLPDGGVGYGMLRYLADDGEAAARLRERPRPQLSFNYLGQLDAALAEARTFRVSRHDPGPTIDARAPRPYLLDVIAGVTDGRLKVTIVFSRNRHERPTVAALAERIAATMRALAAEAAVRGERTARAAEGARAERSLAGMVLVGLRPHGSRPPLFCVHPSGGMATVYTDIARHVGPERPVYGFQSKGWYPDQEPDTRVETMAARYIDAVRSVQPEPPYHLAGWSAGAIIAFEMAQQLAARGEAVALLANIDQPPPDRDAPWQSDAMLLRSMVGHADPEFDERMSRLEPEDQLRYALERAKALDLVPVQADLAQARRFLFIFRVTQAAVREYTPRPYAGCMTLFRAELQPDASWTPRAAFGWEDIVRHVDVRRIPGDHDSIIAEPNAVALGAALCDALQKVCVGRSA